MTTKITKGVNASGEPFRLVWVNPRREVAREVQPDKPEFPDRPMSESEFLGLAHRNHADWYEGDEKGRRV